MTLLKRFYRGYQKHMLRVGREQARTVLLSRSDRILSDLGFSRYLLESGIDAWPWEASQESMPASHLDSVLSSDKEAIKALQALSDIELQDLGISRGVIHHSVTQGRIGIEFDLERKVA
jgi:uncharacterized protein YjiS (DUF1127 family)